MKIECNISVYYRTNKQNPLKKTKTGRNICGKLGVFICVEGSPGSRRSDEDIKSVIRI